MLLKVLSGMDRARFSSRVVSLMGEGTLAGAIRELGVPVDPLGCPPGRLTFGALRRLRHLIREDGADLVQGWMYHANVAASVAAELIRPHIPVLWNVRHTPGALSEEKLRTFAIIRLGAAMSGRPARIVYNSVRSAKRHEQLGFSKARRKIIYNGFDLEQFRPRLEAASELKAELGLPPRAQLVANVAHFSPMKDHPTFVGAAALIARRNPDAHFILAGIGITATNTILMDCIQSHGLGDRVRLLGERKDIQRWLPGIDVAVSASAFGEGFANAIGEAMACGVPCVVTDVGDSAHIVGDAGVVVAPRDPAAIAAPVARLLSDSAERSRLGAQARSRVARLFQIESVATDYATLYDEIFGGHGRVES